jgi:nucleotide-binding universal stress UspA family protein
MSCYRNILVAIDGSPDAAAALRHAVTRAIRTRG